MKVSRIAILLFATVVLAAKADETNLTIDGITYSNVVWRSATPATVSIFHKSGAATIPLEKLPKDFQARFGYDPQKAADYKAAERAAQAARQESLRKLHEEQDADRRWQVQVEADKQEQTARESAQQSALVETRKQAKDAAAKKREEKFLASLGPVTMLKFSYVGAIRLRSDGKYSTSLTYHDDQGYRQSIHCLFPPAGLNYLKGLQRYRDFGGMNGLIVYGRVIGSDSVNVSSVATDASYWLVGMRMVSAYGNVNPAW